MELLASEDLVPAEPVEPVLTLRVSWIGNPGATLALAERMVRTHEAVPFSLVSLPGNYDGSIKDKFGASPCAPMEALIAAGVHLELAVGNHVGASTRRTSPAAVVGMAAEGWISREDSGSGVRSRDRGSRAKTRPCAPGRPV